MVHLQPRVLFPLILSKMLNYIVSFFSVQIYNYRITVKQEDPEERTCTLNGGEEKRRDLPHWNTPVLVLTFFFAIFQVPAIFDLLLFW